MLPEVPRIRVITSRAKNSRTISQAFADGIGVMAIAPKEHMRINAGQPADVIVSYGMLRDLLIGVKWAWRNYKCWIYLDNGYINSGHYDGYYSVTWNAFQHTGEGYYERGEERLKKLNLKWEMESMKKGGEHILVLPPTWIFGSLVGVDYQKWTLDTVAKLQKHTERPIKIRHKPGSRLPTGQIPKDGKTLVQDLEGCHAVVTYNTKAAIECHMRGYPVFSSTNGCVNAVGLDSLDCIEAPLYPSDEERVAWLQSLAANQYTLDEMRSGQVMEWMLEDMRGEDAAIARLGEPKEHFYT